MNKRDFESAIPLSLLKATIVGCFITGHKGIKSQYMPIETNTFEILGIDCQEIIDRLKNCRYED
jgi:hypothetical protein